MNHVQQTHLRSIQNTIAARLAAKYTRGQKEHGGNLWDRPVLRDLVDETTDFNTYLITFEQQLNLMHEKLRNARWLISNGDISNAQSELELIDNALTAQLGHDVPPS